MTISSGQRYLLILATACVVTALFLGPVTLLKINDPAGPWSWFSAVILLIAIESAIVGWWLYSSKPRISHTWYRISEVIVLFVFLRLMLWGMSGEISDVIWLQDLILNPYLIFDLRFLIAFTLTFLAWERSTRFSSILSNLTLSKPEIEFYSATNSSNKTKIEIIPKHRDSIARAYFHSWIMGGFVLIIFAVLTTINLTGASSAGFNIRTIGRLGLREEMLAALLIYFIGGLWLVGQARYQVMQARWLTKGLQTEHSFKRGWSTWTFIILLTVSTFASFLPIGSTFTLSRILQTFLGVALWAINLVLIVFSYLIFMFLSLFDKGSSFEEFEPVELTRSLPAAESLPSSTNLPPLLTTGVFWLVVLATILLSASFVVKNRGIRIDKEPFLLVLTGLINWLRNLISGIGEYSTNLPFSWTNLAEFLPDRSTISSPWRFVRVNSLSPREQVRYFYLSILRRAARQGVSRNPPDTPLEYSHSLEVAWPEEESNVEDLTAAFIKSRYAKEDISLDELRYLREKFKRLRSVVRNKKARTSEPSDGDTNDHTQDFD